ncbi:phospholipase/carboxylesterase [Filibacter limicola]|uniref:Phospholipase/carboxylesterase n=2 Tax=Sporosarcina limicola TaxID=34101 RepID=A0A927MGU5_9BACL|nr:alpha/beta hydrolase [Sporosarcina limicola]MBE1554449.1 phospholipase/carboxylesterase [Sporosarcina limicola]
MQHIFKQGIDKTKPILLLLHGTGGNEVDLLPLADVIDKEASVLSVRGNVMENGMPRFFRRLAEGVYDEEDLVFRTEELDTFLDSASKEYGFDRSNIIAIGYSNGANIAASLLFHHKDSLKGAILHHPLFPREGAEWPNLTGIPVYISAGQNDPFCPAVESTALQNKMIIAGADVHAHWESNGHSLTQTEVQAAADWYQKCTS